MIVGCWFDLWHNGACWHVWHFVSEFGLKCKICGIVPTLQISLFIIQYRKWFQRCKQKVDCFLLFLKEGGKNERKYSHWMKFSNCYRNALWTIHFVVILKNEFLNRRFCYQLFYKNRTSLIDSEWPPNCLHQINQFEFSPTLFEWDLKFKNLIGNSWAQWGVHEKNIICSIQIDSVGTQIGLHENYPAKKVGKKKCQNMTRTEVEVSKMSPHFIACVECNYVTSTFGRILFFCCCCWNQFINFTPKNKNSNHFHVKFDKFYIQVVKSVQNMSKVFPQAWKNYALMIFGNLFQEKKRKQKKFENGMNK